MSILTLVFAGSFRAAAQLIYAQHHGLLAVQAHHPTAGCTAQFHLNLPLMDADTYKQIGEGDEELQYKGHDNSRRAFLGAQCLLPAVALLIMELFPLLPHLAQAQEAASLLAPAGTVSVCTFQQQSISFKSTASMRYAALILKHSDKDSAWPCSRLLDAGLSGFQAIFRKLTA